MALALIGPQSIEELTRLAHNYFAEIQSVGTMSSESVFDGNPVLRSFISNCSETYPFTETGKVIRIKPVKEIRDLSLMFALPPTRGLYRSNPARLISNLISQRSKGSLFSYLHEKGWINSIGGFTRTSFEDFSVFEIAASLTPSGLEHWEDVVRCVFSHLRMVQEADEKELHRIWDEIRTMNSLEFQYSDKYSPYDLAPEIVENMLTFRMEHVFSAGQILDELNYDLLRQFLKRLINPKNALVTLRSPTFEDIPNDQPSLSVDIDRKNVAVKLEKWYEVPYAETSLTNRQIQMWGGPLDAITAFPPTNPFVPYELETKHSILIQKKLRSNPPILVHEKFHDNVLRERIWKSSDEVFGNPKSAISILVDSPYCFGGHPTNNLIGSIFAQTYAEKFYPSSFAGLKYSVSLTSRGILLSFAGFSPKLCAFTKDVTETFCSDGFWKDVPDNIFESCKDKLVRSIAGVVKERPDNICDLLQRYLLQEGTWLPEERLNAAKVISKADVGIAVSKALLRSRITFYSHGDISSSQLHTLADELNATLGMNEDAVVLHELQADKGYGVNPPRYRARVLNIGHHRILLRGFNEDDENSALICHFQATIRSPKTTALLLVIQKLLSEPLFNELRTQKGLGYIVSMAIPSYGTGMKTMRGISVRVVSNKFSPWLIEKELGEFLTSQKRVMATYSQDDIEFRVDALIKNIEDPPTSYLDEAGLYWDNIFDDTPFDWSEQVVAALKDITIAEVQTAANEWLFDRETRRTSSCMIFGRYHVNSIDQPDIADNLELDSAFPLKPAEEFSSLEALSIFRESLSLVI